MARALAAALLLACAGAAAAQSPSACESRTGEARRDCMRKELCAQSKNPAACEANARKQAQKQKAGVERRKQDPKR